MEPSIISRELEIAFNSPLGFAAMRFLKRIDFFRFSAAHSGLVDRSRRRRLHSFLLTFYKG